MFSVHVLQRAPVVRVYGVTERGNSILLYVHNFLPYFYIPTWPDFTGDDLRFIGDALNVRLPVFVAHLEPFVGRATHTRS